MDEFLGWIAGSSPRSSPATRAAPAQLPRLCRGRLRLCRGALAGDDRVDRGRARGRRSRRATCCSSSAMRSSRRSSRRPRRGWPRRRRRSTTSRPAAGRPKIEVARANLNQAEAQLALANAALSRTQELFDKGLAPQARLDQDQAAAESAEARVAQLEAQLAGDRAAGARCAARQCGGHAGGGTRRCRNARGRTWRTAPIVAPVERPGRDALLQRRRDGGGRRAGAVDHPGRCARGEVLRRRDRARAPHARRRAGGHLRRLRDADRGDAQPARVRAAVHAAGDLQPRRAQPHGVPRRGDARRCVGGCCPASR